MAIRPLVIIPDAQLRLISKPVAGVTREIRSLVDDMFATMYDAPGIGLAAIQIGEAQRVVTIDLARKEEKAQPLVLINPEITWKSEELREMEEGCLSIPEYYESVERPDRIRVRFHDIDFKQQEIEADGLLATCIQHEVDHLNGVLFIDYLSKLKRDRVAKKFAKQAKQRESEA